VGTLVDIRGGHFTGATSVMFNGAAAVYTVDSDSELHATVPSSATTGLISVTTPSGTGRSGDVFMVTAPPTARFAFSCSALMCSFDANGSSDTDGTIQSYTWNFGDGTSSSGIITAHSYAQSAAYLVTLMVTDNDGATGIDSQTFNLITLRARGYKVHELEKVDLAWSGPAGANFDVYRSATLIATVFGNSYTDTIGRNRSGTFTYRVCSTTTSVCSNTASVSF
jgi:hypothetical protein